VPINTVEDVDGLHFIAANLGPGKNADVVMFDLHESDESACGEIFASSKQARRALAGRAG
jgi:hypothetical protein